MMTVIFYCWSPIISLNEDFALPLTILQYGENTVLVKPVQSKIMAYLQDFYPLDIDNSYTEYVISGLKYDDNDFYCWTLIP